MTVIEEVVAPVDQRIPDVTEEVSTTVPPEQKVNGPFAETEGVAGSALTVTETGVDVYAVQ